VSSIETRAQASLAAITGGSWQHFVGKKTNLGNRRGSQPDGAVIGDGFDHTSRYGDRSTTLDSITSAAP